MRAINHPLYFDYQATTPTDPRVVAAMQPYFFEDFGNPHSTGHVYGKRALDAVTVARAGIADLIAAAPEEMIFTSGATEANNLAIQGVLGFRLDHPVKQGEGLHFITTEIEHKCVLENAAWAGRQGIDVTYLRPDQEGRIDPSQIETALRPNTVLVSIIAAQNEIGTIQSLAAIGALCRAHGALFHSDGAQALGKFPLDVEAMKIDLLSLSGHKIYGPKGIGALYVRHRPRIRLRPLMLGGGQEHMMRSGTLPVPLCVGFGEACRIARDAMAEETARLKRLASIFLRRLHNRIPNTHVNGPTEGRLPGNLNLAFPDIDALALQASLAPVMAVSTGSACSSASVEPSYVLKSIGLTECEARSSIRIGMGRFTTEREVENAADFLADAVIAQGKAGRRP